MSSLQWPWSYRPPKWVLAVFAVVSAAVGLLIEAAHLTVAVPEAASKWAKWLAPLRQLLPPALFLYGFLVAWVLALLIILLSARRERRGEESNSLPTPPPTVAASAVLSVDLSVDNLTHSYPDKPGALIEAGYQKRAFALLTVKNIGDKNLHEIVAECRLVKHGAVPCHWSKESDGKFSLGGRHAEDLNVCQERVLVIAQALENDRRRWALLPARQDILFSTLVTSPAPYGQVIESPDGESLKLGGKAEMIVELHGEGANHAEHILLSFDADGPTISRLP